MFLSCLPYSPVESLHRDRQGVSLMKKITVAVFAVAIFSIVAVYAHACPPGAMNRDSDSGSQSSPGNLSPGEQDSDQGVLDQGLYDQSESMDLQQSGALLLVRGGGGHEGSFGGSRGGEGRGSSRGFDSDRGGFENRGFGERRFEGDRSGEGFRRGFGEGDEDWDDTVVDPLIINPF